MRGMVNLDDGVLVTVRTWKKHALQQLASC